MLAPEGDGSDPDNAGLLEGLRDWGYADGRNVTLNWRSSGGGRQLPKLAAELVKLPVDLIVTKGTGPSVAARRASASAPIVMAYCSDAVHAGLVVSLARPGANVTGPAALSGPSAAGVWSCCGIRSPT